MDDLLGRFSQCWFNHWSTYSQQKMTMAAVSGLGPSLRGAKGRSSRGLRFSSFSKGCSMCISLDYSWHFIGLHDTTLPYITLHRYIHEWTWQSRKVTGIFRPSWVYLHPEELPRSNLSRKLGTPIMNGHEPLWHIVTSCDRYIPSETFWGKKGQTQMVLLLHHGSFKTWT